MPSATNASSRLSAWRFLCITLSRSLPRQTTIIGLKAAPKRAEIAFCTMMPRLFGERRSSTLSLNSTFQAAQPATIVTRTEPMTTGHGWRSVQVITLSMPKECR